MKADLHIHSIFSDGEDTPEQIVQKAKANGLQLISLTDHDTIDGQEIIKKAAEANGIEFFYGIELSTFSCAEIHILGYNMDIKNRSFLKLLKIEKQKRIERLTKMIKRLNLLGIDITENEVYAVADNTSSIGRLHLAKVLTAKNITKSVADAFDRLLGFGKAVYVPTDRLKPESAIKMINKAGGKAVLAHPMQISINKQNLIPLITQLKSYGICGIEAHYYAHTKFEKDFLTQLARKLNLLVTCGSDYHGKQRNSDITAFELEKEDYIRLKQ